MNVLGIVQLCHSTEPGNFGLGLDRFGMERPRSPEELAHLVKSMLSTSIAPTDGVATGVSFRAARHGAFERLPEVCSALSSSRREDPARLESIHRGRRLWGLSRSWEWAAGMHGQLDDMAEHTDLHHAVAFGALVSETTASEARAIATYLFSTARGIVLTAIREIPLDEAVGQRVLAEVQGAIAEMASRCVDRRPEDIDHA